MENVFNPDAAIDALELYGPMSVADFGAGAGFLTLPLSKKISSDGKVFAFDIQEAPLAVLRKRAGDEQKGNIETIRADLERPRGSQLADSSVDRVVIANILFQAERKDLLFEEAYRILHEQGRLLIIEWFEETDMAFGPPQTLRISQNDASQFAQAAGFIFEKQFEAGSHHYGLLFQKNNP